LPRSNFKFVIFVFLLNALTLSALLALHVALMAYFRHIQATDLMVTIRNDLMMGERQAVFLNLSSRLGSGKSFVSIRFIEHQNRDSILIGDRFGDRFRSLKVENPFLYGEVTVPVYFDADMRNTFGVFVFYYERFDNLNRVLLIWISLGAFLIALAYRQKRQIQAAVVQQVSSRRNEAIAQMSQMLSHDMRAPLGVFERLLISNDENIAEMRPAIRESVNRLYAMVDSLRYGDMENIISKKEYSLEFSFGYESLIGKAEVHQVDLEVPRKGISAVLIDLPKVERAWINLTSNAIEFAKTFVRVNAVAVGNDLFIRVIDDGPGVPEEILPRLFQRGVTHGKQDGTGLGLAYVKQVMMGHGGDVRYYRENNVTVFECFIPGAIIHQRTPVTILDSVKVKRNEPLYKKVGIVFRDDSLSFEIMDKLRALEANAVLWYVGFDRAHDFIITDDQKTVELSLHEGISVAEFKPGTPVGEIVRKTRIRLGIPTERDTKLVRVEVDPKP
jgi:signal transduction histidine kinase